MSVLFLTGWEHGGADIVPLVGTPTASTTQKRTGNYSFHCPTIYDGALLSLMGDYADEGIYVGVAIYLTAGAGSTVYNLIACVGEAYAECGVGLAPNSTTLVLYRGSAAVVQTLAVGTTLQLNTWYYLNLYATVSDEEEGIGGVMRCYLNGVLDMAYSGDTKQSSLALNRVGIACTGLGRQPVFGAKGYYDDLVIGTAGVGQCGIELLKPKGAGNSTQLTNTGDYNWEDVAEVPADDDASYVYENTADLKDTYELTDTALVGTIKAVQWFARARAEDEGTTGHIKRVFRIDGTDYAGDALGVDSIYRYVHEVVEVNPDDDGAWAQADLDAMEAGVQIA